ncbi:hypothetical protein N7478_004935 [Penicillium angulare]|uniref:uncharacterized protein n=1 Tax=Penicillium angulare TaxID=116970 RepID=UPI00253FB2F8|nr:uncharacterized protein N7478_004935 [Penicillium angulare]KAJ5279563.1 hypothetical protein N7478_004935 [Penicillium angulare]
MGEEESRRAWIANNPVLPSIPIKSSFAYGSQAGPAARRRQTIHARPGTTDLREIERSVNEAIKNSELAALNPKTVKDYQKDAPKRRARNENARRRIKREPTPDETQLHQALREVTASPRKESPSQKSDPTPSPPVPRTVSTDSSPAAEPPLQRHLSVMSNSPDLTLYPSPLKRGGHDTHDLTTPDRFSRQSSVDNASVISWNLERDINEDDLKRTRPSTQGSNITAPPRRPSGLANIVPDTIEEENEDEEEKAEGNDYYEDEADERELSEHFDKFESEIEAGLVGQPIPDPAVESWTASVKTIIPTMFRSEQSPEPDCIQTPSTKEHLVQERPTLRPESRSRANSISKSNRANWVRAGIVLSLSIVVALAFQMGLFEKIHIPHFPPPVQYSPNTSEPATVRHLKNQVSKMNEEMSSLSRDLVSVRSKHARDSVPTYITDQPFGYEKPLQKINFLSPALGAIVDPRQTSPAVGLTWPIVYRGALKMIGLGYMIPKPMPPSTALKSWQESGDCWCTSQKKGSSQISILLGRDIVPQEVVVEHVPADATLNPERAPKEIELWARYRVIPLPTDEFSRSWISRLTGFGDSRPERPIEPVSSRKEGLGGYTIPGEKSLHDVLMSTLRATNFYDPDTSFSDDPLLGPNFYRIGKMTYDIHKKNYIQRFDVNTVVDIPTIRVDKVAFRIKSNWGSNDTCIYRLKVHGHM